MSTIRSIQNAWGEFVRVNNKTPSVVIVGKRAFDDLRIEAHKTHSSLLRDRVMLNEDEMFNGVRLVISNRLDDISVY